MAQHIEEEHYDTISMNNESDWKYIIPGRRRVREPFFSLIKLYDVDNGLEPVYPHTVSLRCDAIAHSSVTIVSAANVDGWGVVSSKKVVEVRRERD